MPVEITEEDKRRELAHREQLVLKKKIGVLELKIAKVYEARGGVWQKLFGKPEIEADKLLFNQHHQLASLYHRTGDDRSAYFHVLKGLTQCNVSDVQSDLLWVMKKNLLVFARSVCLEANDQGLVIEALKQQIKGSSQLLRHHDKEMYVLAHKELKGIYEQNGEPDKAQILYQAAMDNERFILLNKSNRIEFMLSLGDMYCASQDWKKAKTQYQITYALAKEGWKYAYLTTDQTILLLRCYLMASLLNEDNETLKGQVTRLIEAVHFPKSSGPIRFTGAHRTYNDNAALKSAIQAFDILNIDLPPNFPLMYKTSQSIRIKTNAKRPELPGVFESTTSQKDPVVQQPAGAPLEEDTLETAEYLSLQAKMTRDWQDLGVAGYQDTIDDILQRVFLPRAFPPEVIKALDIKPPRGALLVGPPGTGKTLIARTIAEHFFEPSQVKVINGPELLSRYVGQSEENLRRYFELAKIHPNKTFVYIIDEIDALAPKRSTHDSVSASVGSKMTTTLLTTLDGVKPLPNIIVIGVTNFSENLDDALTRPGRLGERFEIGLPTYDDRLAILQLFMKPLRDKGLISDATDVAGLAVKTEGFSGAELVQLVERAKSTIFPSLFEFKEGKGIHFNNDIDLTELSIDDEALNQAYEGIMDDKYAKQRKGVLGGEPETTMKHDAATSPMPHNTTNPARLFKAVSSEGEETSKLRRTVSAIF